MLMYLLLLLPKQLLTSLALRLRHNISMTQPNDEICITIEVNEKIESLGCLDTSKTVIQKVIATRWFSASQNEADTSRLNIAPVWVATTCARHNTEPQERCTQPGSKCKLLEHD
ncbi:uncharacterized protein B0I36DRAFT_334995, partial [Microdochium trichocladiopsis]